MSRRARLAELLAAQRAMRAARDRERWAPERLAAHRQRALDALVRDVAAGSPWWRARLGGARGRDGHVRLDAVPPLDKRALMADLDAALTDPRLRGRDLRVHLHDPGPLPSGHRVMASSGSTGTPSLYVYSRSDWTGILALFLRYAEFAGIRPRLPRLKIAPVGAPTRASMTQRVAQSVDTGVHRVLPLSVATPLDELVARLNGFRPDVVNAYPSVAALLAQEQLAGRLRIAPRIFTTSSELRTPEMAARIERAFGVRPVDLYATTEGLWGTECEHHAGVHLFEDWCVAENVDATGRPVPDGEPGARLLITNLFNRTLPLIRFEVSDVVVLDRRPCACGRTLPRLAAVRGRADDVLRLPGRDGRPVSVHPTQFSALAADDAVREFQVVRRGDALVLRLALRDGGDPTAPDRLAREVAERLAGLGVALPAVGTELVDGLERTAGGKLPLVVSA